MKHGIPFPGGMQRTAVGDPGSSAEPLSHATVPAFVTARPGAGAKPPTSPTGTQGSKRITTVAVGVAPPADGTGGETVHPLAGRAAGARPIIACSAQRRSAAVD